MSKNRISQQEDDSWMGDCGKYASNVENFKRRRALPPLPVLAGNAKFFDRLLSVRREDNLVFITKAAAKNR